MPAPEVEELETSRPIPSNFSWVVPDKIAGMAQPTNAHQLQRLREHLGVAMVVNLTNRNVHRVALQSLGNNAPRLVHAPLPDYGSPHPAQLEHIVAQMKNALDNNQAVAIHCCGGLGRTGVVIACYLVAEHGMPVHEAIRLVREKRPHSVVCRKQELAVYRFATYRDEKAKSTGL